MAARFCFAFVVLALCAVVPGSRAFIDRTAVPVAAAAPHNVRWHWTRGHSGHIENEKVDKLARQEALAMAEKN